MNETIPQDIMDDLRQAARLHERAAADFGQCQEFNKIMSDLLGRLEDAHCYRTADKVMTILLNCNPKDGAHCDKNSMVGDKIKGLVR